MEIKLGKIYLTKTNGKYYSNWIVKPKKRRQMGKSEFDCLVIKDNNKKGLEYTLPFASYELIEISPVMLELFEIGESND